MILASLNGAPAHADLLPAPRVLIADDQEAVLESLHLLLKGNGYRIDTASSPDAILDAVQSSRFDAVLMDLNYTRGICSGDAGLETLSRIREMDDSLPVIVMTAWGSIRLAVEAMRRGASDFIQKPWENESVLETLRARARGGGDANPRKGTGEMLRASRVQRSLTPQAPVSLGSLEYAGACVQAGAVGGDYCDFIPMGPDRVGLVLADASGKGVPAALLMANLQATMRSQCAARSAGMASLLRSVNRLFCESTAPEHYATMFFGEYDETERVLRFVNCGHPPPVLLRADDRVERLPATATVLGLLDPWDCENTQVGLSPGDMLAVFSDGIVEAGRASGEEFGEERLIELLRKHRDRSCSDLIQAVNETISVFGGADPWDDRTLIIARAR